MVKSLLTSLSLITRAIWHCLLCVFFLNQIKYGKKIQKKQTFITNVWKIIFFFIEKSVFWIYFYICDIRLTPTRIKNTEYKHKYKIMKLRIPDMMRQFTDYQYCSWCGQKKFIFIISLLYLFSKFKISITRMHYKRYRYIIKKSFIAGFIYGELYFVYFLFLFLPYLMWKAKTCEGGA